MCKFVLCRDYSVVLECTTPSPGLETLRVQTGTFLCRQHRKGSCWKARDRGVPRSILGKRGTLHTPLSWKLGPHRGAEWRFLTGFPQTRGSSSGVETCIIFLPPHLSLAQKKRFYPVITLGKQNIKGPSIPHRGKKLAELHRRVQAWKYGVYREKDIFLKALAQNLLHSAFKKCLMKQSLQTSSKWKDLMVL